MCDAGWMGFVFFFTKVKFSSILNIEGEIFKQLLSKEFKLENHKVKPRILAADNLCGIIKYTWVTVNIPVLVHDESKGSLLNII